MYYWVNLNFLRSGSTRGGFFQANLVHKIYSLSFQGSSGLNDQLPSFNTEMDFTQFHYFQEF
jgi:hypothetical protein